MAAASIFALCAILIAYASATGIGRTPIAQASTESALLQQIATKDSTGDGLPDWQKGLYGIPLDATTTDYFHLGMTDGEAVAKGLIVPVAATPAAPTATPSGPANVGGVPAPAQGSLTDAFAKNFFSLYVAAKQQAGGQALTEAQTSAIADQAIAQLQGSVAPAPDFKTAADLKVAGAGTDALRAYAASAEAVFRAHGQNMTGNELDLLTATLNGSDTGATAQLEKIAAAYQDTAIGLAALTVPQETASAHLALINALARTGAAVESFARVGSDPIATMFALQQYPQGITASVSAFQGIAQVYANAGITIANGQPGGYFINMVTDLKAAQASAK